MELTQENVEKLNVAKMPDALLCKGLLLDAIEAGDALEKELSNLRQDYRKISELYISEQNKCGHLEARIKELEEDLVEERGVNAGLRLRIKELESIPHTDNTAVIEALQRDKDDLIELNEKRIAQIKELEEQLHELAERECVLCRKKIKELEAENKQLKDKK